MSAARSADAQRGAATVLVVTMSGLLLAVGSALGLTSALVVAHRRAQAAADLAALAAAEALSRGGDPCGAAATVAASNDARIDGCTVDGRVVELVVSVTAQGPAGRLARLQAQARAGPAP